MAISIILKRLTRIASTIVSISNDNIKYALSEYLKKLTFQLDSRSIQVLLHFKTKADILYLKSTKNCILKVLFRKRNNAGYRNCTNMENQVHLIGYPTCMSHFKRFLQIRCSFLSEIDIYIVQCVGRGL